MREVIKKLVYKILEKSLILTNKERDEVELKKKLKNIIPDLTHQYSTVSIDMNNSYVVNKMRGQHTFQMSLALKAVSLLTEKKDVINIVDIGDSSGSHMIYLDHLLEGKTNTLSVNIDPIAVDKIKAKGLNALLCPAEELHLHKNGMKADIFLSYQMLEHLFNPIDFLHSMAEKSSCEYFAITVPYVYRSRVALNVVKYNQLEKTHPAEKTHVFEFSPEDWDLIFQFSGWEIIYQDKYTQYPKSWPFHFTKYIWRKFDFDGFYGVILKKNDKYSKKYLDW